MRRRSIALLLLLLGLAGATQGCAPIPLPHYSAFRPNRVDELLVDSENLRQAADEWKRFWFLDQPSHMTPYRTDGGLGF